MKKIVIHTPNLAAIRFVGDFNKKLFEIGARKIPILKKEDDNIVIVTQMEASLLGRKPHFEAVDINTLFVNENTQAPAVVQVGDLTTEKIEEFRILFTDRGLIVPITGLTEINKQLFDRGFDQVDLLGVETPEATKKAEVELNKIIDFIKDKLPNEIEAPNEMTFSDVVIGLLERLTPKNGDTAAGCVEEDTQELKPTSLKDVVIENTTEEQDTYTLPFSEDIDTLDIDEVKTACDFAGVVKGNKGIEKLKAILLPHLPSKEL